MVKELSKKALERKENRWCDLTSLLLMHIEYEEDMGFCKLEDYKRGAECFEDGKVIYGLDEQGIWDGIFKMSESCDYDDLHNKFKNAKWCDHENLMIFELLNGVKFCAMRL